MAKLGVITDGISRDLAHALQVARAAGLTYAELQYVWDKEIGDHDRNEIRQMKALLDEHGLAVPCVSRHILTGAVTMATKPTDTVYIQHLDALKRCIAASHALGSPLTRIFSGRKEMILFGSGGAEHWNVAKGAWAALVPLIDPFVRVAEAENAVLVVETGNGTMINSSWLARKLIDEIGSDRLKVLWDPANNCYAHEKAYPDGYESIRGRYLAHIHIKDVKVDTPKASLEVREMGKGELADQFASIAAALRADSYDGVVCFESVYHPAGGSFEDGFRRSIGKFKQLFGQP